jgi:hypothetical protein
MSMSQLNFNGDEDGSVNGLEADAGARIVL